jgi:prepilin-type N-terminal cleavage/methylation domain-containing protein
MIKKLRKGFTLVELVVVIAVIAILAAVSVVSYIGITKKAKESNDHSLIDQINLSVAASSSISKKATLHEVLEDLKEDSGFGVEKLKPELEGAEFVYSYSMNKFAYWKGNEVVYPQDVVDNANARGLDLWFFADVDSNGSLKDGHSHYIRSSQSKTIVTDAGLDVGDQAINEVRYERGSTSPRQEVVIRTDGGSLVVDAPIDHVRHYGIANLADLKAVAPTSYVEYGNVSMAKIKTGRIVVSETAVLPAIHVVETNGNYDGISIALMGNATLPELSRDEVAMNEGDEKLVVEVQAVANETAVDDSPEYIWISMTGSEISTDVASSGSTLDSSTIIPAASQSAAAKQAAEEAVEGLTPEEVEEKEEVATRYAGGKGTEKSPYLLSTKHHFESIDEDYHDGLTDGKYFKLVADLDLGKIYPIGTTSLVGNNGAASQGYTITYTSTFKGNLDGGNHSITYSMVADNGLSSSSSVLGLFGAIEDSVIKDLIINADVSSDRASVWVGALAGFGWGCDLENVIVNGSVTGAHDVGGFFGYYANGLSNIHGTNTFKNCVNNASVVCNSKRTSYAVCGGFVGQFSPEESSDFTINFINCQSNGAVVVENTASANAGLSYFVGFASDNASAKGYNITFNFSGCTVGPEASYSNVLGATRTKSNKTVYCGLSAAGLAACPQLKYIGITSKLWGSVASTNRIVVNSVQQDMSLYFVAA